MIKKGSDQEKIHPNPPLKRGTEGDLKECNV